MSWILLVLYSAQRAFHWMFGFWPFKKKISFSFRYLCSGFESHSGLSHYYISSKKKKKVRITHFELCFNPQFKHDFHVSTSYILGIVELKWTKLLSSMNRLTKKN